MATTPFDYDQFIIDYPEFASYSEGIVTNIYNHEAVVMALPLSGSFCDDSEQYYFNCLVLAHILYGQMNGLPGRPSSVTQGSESIAFELKGPKWAAYWDKTPYGQRIAQLIAMGLSGGHYISNGEMPYSSQSMTGVYDNGIFGWGWIW